MLKTPFGLIADIGGTNARFALCDAQGEVSSSQILNCKDFPTIEEAVKAYLNGLSNPVIKTAAFAVACPVLGDKISMTNNPWSFSISELKKALDLEHFEVVNDFVAQALAVLKLSDNQKKKVGTGEAVEGFPIAVIGPGTGLGVSLLIPTKDGYQAVASEGGHVTMSASCLEEQLMLSALQEEFDHVSAERVISGMGLTNLYKALLLLKGETTEPLCPEEISEKALKGDELSKKAVETMFALLGTLAGNLALTAGALGGVYIAGGIIPRDGLLEMFEASLFRTRFEEKGRFQEYLSHIPTYVMISENPAFQGLSSLIEKSIKK